MTLRSAVARQMVRFHDIPLSLAEEHVAAMDREELLDRFKRYWRRSCAERGMELSAVSPNLRAGNASSAKVSRPATMTADIAALNPVSGEALSMPDSEVKKPWQSREAAEMLTSENDVGPGVGWNLPDVPEKPSGEGVALGVGFFT